MLRTHLVTSGSVILRSQVVCRIMHHVRPARPLQTSLYSEVATARKHLRITSDYFNIYIYEVGAKSFRPHYVPGEIEIKQRCHFSI